MRTNYLNLGRCGGGICVAASGVEFASTIYLSRRICDGCAQKTKGSGREEREREGEGREQRHHGNSSSGDKAGFERKWRDNCTQRRSDSSARLRSLSRERTVRRRRTIGLAGRRTRDHGEIRPAPSITEWAFRLATSVGIISRPWYPTAKERNLVRADSAITQVDASAICARERLQWEV